MDDDAIGMTSLGAEGDFRAFWGKARPFEGAASPAHAAAWHGLDVAAAFAELLRWWPDLKTAIIGAFAEETDEIVPALLVLVALHDVGKFARTFQAKVQDVFPACLGAWRPPPAAYHDRIGFGLAESAHHLGPLMKTLFAPDELAHVPILSAVFGHHGQPVVPDRALDLHMGGPDKPASRCTRAFANAVHELMGRPRLPPLKKNAEIALSWRLAGAVALADWLGSDQRRFRYEPPEWDIADYWARCAVPRAKDAVATSGLVPAPVSSHPVATRVLPDASEPSAAQRWAAELSLDDGGLFIIEDVMGSGKTEAALILAHRLMQAGRAGGLYLALPTMATANALYRRMDGLYRHLFAADASPSLILAHGARDLDAGFVASLGLDDEGAMRESYGAGVDGETASAACARWLADDRRKAFLADIGVGTIDQALLAILPVKHAGVRQAGLSRRVLIVDEAHCYDFYMQRELESLIEHQARMSAPVIVLSATLPDATRRRLAAAFAKGAGRPAPALAGEAYPLATAVGGVTVETPLAARPDLCRSVAIRRLGSPEAAEALVAEAARQGAAVAYIRNTVDDALESHRRIAAMGLDVELFHARFAMGDRLAIENRIVDRFGRHGAAEGRRSRILVATQVVEQSIDLDFDLLVTDLAPADLVLQRLGRIWRHRREGRGWPRPEIAVVSPEPMQGAAADWYSALLPRAQWVYRDHALLWQSARQLFARETIRVPDDLRAIVEAAYDPAALDDAPEALQRSGWEALGKAQASRSHAVLNVLDFTKGYMPRSGGWGPDTVTPTRLGDERRILRLCVWEDGRLRPWCIDPDEKRAWALSEVSVRASRVTGRAGLPPEIEYQAAALDARWAERGVPALAMPVLGGLEGVGKVFYHQATTRAYAFYSPSEGLAWKQATE